MRRLVVNGRFLAQVPTGVQRYALETLRALDRRLSREPQYLQGTRWQLAMPRDAQQVPLLENFEFHMLPFLRGHAWEQGPLRSFARCAYLVNLNYSAPLFKRDQLVTVHDASVRAHPQSFSLAYRCLNDMMVGQLAPRVDTLMTVSEFSAAEIAARFDLRRDDIVVGHEGGEHVLGHAARDDDAAVLRRHGLESERYLLAVGSLKPNKNFALIPRALQLLGDAPRPTVAVAGARDARVFQGDDAPDGAMRLLGFVPDAELVVLYRHAAWFIFPSLYEGFGLPAVEAMACGCPVLAARAAAIPEVCGNAALYFDPHDPASLAARLREATDPRRGPPLRAQLRERAAARLARHSWDANAQVLLQRLVRVGAVGTAPVGVLSDVAMADPGP